MFRQPLKLRVVNPISKKADFNIGRQSFVKVLKMYYLETFFAPAVYRYLARAALFVLGLLYVLRIRIRKPRRIFYVIFPAVAIGYVAFWIMRMTR
jgi:hypothetical protein